MSATSDAPLVLPSAASEGPDRSKLITPLPEHPVASFTGIWRYWGRGKNRWAVLKDINLQLAPGTATCIGGRNGAGKTTLLRIATGILAPDHGTVTVNGITTRESWRKYHHSIGFLSAGDRGLYARVGVRSHLEYVARLAFIPRSERKEAVDAALVRFGLTDLAKRRADRLSQGQRQRLRLALTLVHRPNVVLLDEPRNSLDAEGLEMLGAAIREVLVDGGAAIWCAPAGEEQPLDFDRVLLIEDGRLRAV